MTREISRRRFMQAMIAAGLSASAASVLAACGAPAPVAAPPTATQAATATAAAPTAASVESTLTVTPALSRSAEELHLNLPDGRVLEVRATGPKDGEILLFHHGTPMAGLPFAPFVEAAAARGLRTVMYSRPGYGASTSMPGRRVIDAAADAGSVVDALGAKTFHTIGWSGGGPHALACAVALPDRCLATVAISSPAPYSAEGIDWFDAMCQDNVQELRLALQGAAVLKPLLAGVAPTPRPEDVEGHPASCLPQVDRAQLTGDFGAWLSEARRLALAHGTDGWQDDDLAIVSDWGFDLRDPRPVAIYHGGQDRLVPPAHGAWLAEQIPDARWRLLASEGHLSTAANAFERILDDLLDLAH